MRIWLGGMLGVLCLCAARPGQAQVVQSAVGGVAIDARGVVHDLDVDALGQLRKLRAAALDPVPDALASSGLRKVSLRRLEAAIARHRATGKPLPDEIRYLAGLQRVTHLFVDPDQQDIVLAGPAEAWHVGPQGEVVGISTGRPVLHLDNLLVALRTAESSAETGITCSIEPTEEGLRRLKSFLRDQRGAGSHTLPGVERSLGLQNVLVQGLPEHSRFAQVIVSADYRMKRLAMDFEEPLVSGMPSFMDLTRNTRLRNMMPRWWMAVDYDAILRDEEGLAFEIRGQGVKTLTEEDVFSGGKRVRSREAHPLARQWADNMTGKFEELAAVDNVFGELRNCIDLSVVAALLVKEQLPARAGYHFTVLQDAATLPTHAYPVPRAVPSQGSLVRKGKNWEVSASGGVDLDPWSVLQRQEVAPELAELRGQHLSATEAWAWN